MSTLKSNNEDMTINADGASSEIILQQNATERMRIDSSGNVGIGVTPESWNVYDQVFEIGNASVFTYNSTDELNISANSYYNSGHLYKNTGEASRYQAVNGTHIFYVASSGTADSAISWTTAMIIDNSGNVATPGITLGNGTTYNAANHLDDYEEGTWTPTISASGTLPTFTYTNREGTYTKIGRQVTLQCYLRVNLTAVGTGYPIITGSPFSPAAGGSVLSGTSQGIFNLLSGNELKRSYMNGSSILFATSAYQVASGGYMTFSITFEV